MILAHLLTNLIGFIVKPADQSIQSKTTMTSDSALTFQIENGATYFFEALLFIDSPTTADCKYGIDLSGGLGYSLFYERQHSGPNGTSIVRNVETSATSTAITGTVDGVATAKMSGYITNVSGATLTFAVQFAQNASVASNTTMKAGSRLIYGKCG